MIICRTKKKKMKIDHCDVCDNKPEEMVYVRMRRPSDPTDLSCVMAGCEECMGPRQHPENHWNSVPTVMTNRDWDIWVENYGAKHNVLWLT